MESVGALAKLFETRYPLCILIVGALFFLIATLSGDLSVGNIVIPIDQKYDNILLGTGCFLVIAALLLFFLSPFLQAPITRVKQTSEAAREGFNGRIFLQQKQQINDLDEALKRVDELTANQEDYVSRNVQTIIKSVGQTLIEIRDRPKRTALLVQWIDDNKEKWIKEVPNSAYKKIKWRNKKLFFSEIEAHLDLLKNNISRGKYSSPRKVGLTRHINDLTPYISSMGEIETLATRDLDKEDYIVLGGDERSTFFRYFRRLLNDMQ